MTLSKVLLFILGIATPPLLFAAVTHSLGIARDAEDQTFRYVEHHQYLPSGEHLVSYFDPSGAVIASKTLSYPGLPQHPELVQTDFARGVQVETKNTNQTLDMTRKLFDQVETFEFPLDETTIVDAGFDRYLQTNGQFFQAGIPKVYKLVVAGEARALKVQITKQPTSGTNIAYTIKPKNFFVRLLVPEMRVLYDSDHRLLAYEGLTNLNLPGSQGQKVTIEFSNYRSENQLVGPRSEWLPVP